MADTTGRQRHRVILIENNPLTSWAIKQTLSDNYTLVHCSSADEAEKELARGEPCCVIVGSPVADEHPYLVQRLVELANGHALVLVSDPDTILPAGARVIEKPFELSRFAELLADEFSIEGDQGKMVIPMHSPANQPNASSQYSRLPSLEERLRGRFEREICTVCVHRTADGGCSVKKRIDGFECPVFEWAAKIAKLVDGVESSRLGDYIDRIQSIICPECRQAPNGCCKDRDRLDCPLDLYAGLVIPIVDDELKRGRPG